MSVISLLFLDSIDCSFFYIAVHGFVLAGSSTVVGLDAFGFRGLDNIGVVDRSQPFPNGAPGQ